MAWDLSFGFFSRGTFESFRNENNFFADGAISNILQKLNPTLLNKKTKALFHIHISSRNKVVIKKIRKI